MREGLLPPSIRLLFNQPIESGEPPNDAQHKLLTKATIGPGEVREGLAEERISGNRFFCPRAQNANSDFSWFLSWQATTIATRIHSREPFRESGALSNDP